MHDPATGRSREILQARHDEDCTNGERTVIPNGGLTYRGRSYIQYMSVTCWDETRGAVSTCAGGSCAQGAGVCCRWQGDAMQCDQNVSGCEDHGDVWIARHSGIAYSDDGGITWFRNERGDNPMWDAWAARDVNGDGVIDGRDWQGLSPFGQAAMVRRGSRVYFFGAQSGRVSGVRLARVSPRGLLDPSRYQYWDGSGWIQAFDGAGFRSDHADAAAVIVPAPVAGEVSVQYNSHFRRWLMMYLHPTRDAIVLRDAPAPTGPWSEEKIVVTRPALPYGPYGPYIHPWFNDGTDLYFTLSLWDPYDVYLAHVTLRD